MRVCVYLIYFLFFCFAFKRMAEQREKKKEKNEFNSTVTLVLVTGTHTTVNSTTIRNQTRVKPFTSTMLLHNNSLKYIRIMKT